MLRKYDKFLKINPAFTFWSDEEKAILLANLDKKNKELALLLPNRSATSIKTIKNDKIRELRINNQN
jgi:hypothetical protein